MNQQPIDKIEFLIKQGVSKSCIEKYWQVFFEILDDLADNHTTTFDDIKKLFTVKQGTVSKNLKEYLRYYHQHINKIVGFYPSVDAIIDLAETRIGKLTKNNLFDINMCCKEIVDSITWPKHDCFIYESLNKIGEIKNSIVSIDYNVLAKFMYEDYSDFLTGSDNGRVSIAGRMNEEILLRALEVDGLTRDKDFTRTGTNSIGDIQFHHSSKKHITLYCEVKSYKARERFLRGLRDIPYADKIGVGFFLDAREFNPKRTKTLLAANPLAIYLPDKTFVDLHSDSKTYRTTDQNLLYRKLSRFVDDMSYFVTNGKLPDFT